MRITRALSERLHSQHEAISAGIEGLTAAQLNRKPLPEKWSVHENIAHLALYQLVFLERLDRILAADGVSFGRYQAPADPAFPSWCAKEVNELLERIGLDRSRIAEKIMSLHDAELQKTGTHPVLGRLTIPEWTEFFLLHEAHHLYTIFQLVHRPE